MFVSQGLNSSVLRQTSVIDSFTTASRFYRECGCMIAAPFLKRDRVGRLQLIHEYHPDEQDGEYGQMHKVTCMFSANLRPGSTPSFPDEPDPQPVAIEWLDTKSIGRAPLLPALGEYWSHVNSGEASEMYIRDTLI